MAELAVWLVALVVLLQLAVAGLLLYLGLRIRRRFRTMESRIVDASYAPTLDRILKPAAPLPRAGDWAVSTDFVVELMRVLQSSRPSLVVELGSGLSTQVISLLLKSNGGGRLVSIDHDAGYAEKTRVILAANEVTDLAVVRHAELVASEVSPLVPWYDVAQLDDLRDVDLLVVDGPPASVHPNIREPALNFFWDRLAPAGMIVFDDASRHAEKTMIASFARVKPDAEVEWLQAEKGMAVVRKRCFPN